MTVVERRIRAVRLLALVEGVSEAAEVLGVRVSMVKAPPGKVPEAVKPSVTRGARLAARKERGRTENDSGKRTKG